MKHNLSQYDDEMHHAEKDKLIHFIREELEQLRQEAFKALEGHYRASQHTGWYKSKIMIINEILGKL